MTLLDQIRTRFTEPAAQVQKPGRHSTVGLIDRLTREIDKLRESHSKEIQGYKDALQRAGREVHQARAGKVNGAVLNRCPQRDHDDFWVHTNVPQRCPWCEIVRLREQIQMLVTRPTPRPDTILPEQEPVSDVTAETQAVDVAELRKAVGEDDTRTLPVVSTVVPVEPDEPLPPVTWGVTATKPLWKVPFGPGSSDPTEVSRITGQRAVASVDNALGEAS